VTPLRKLLDLQRLDLASDELTERRRTLPERQALEQVLARAADLDADHAGLRERREGLGRTEHELDVEVEAVAAKARKVEGTLYSGTVSVPKELASHQEELRLLRARQADLEAREMELLEQIEAVESDLARNRSSRALADREADAIRGAIEKAESEVDAELARLAAARSVDLGAVPTHVLAAYDRLRGKERLHGRAAGPLANGICGGCHVKLPRIAYERMKLEPEDALLTCTSCGRLLVR
jgi:predicted  nucleic acid-binding Zn-ribbon protein